MGLLTKKFEPPILNEGIQESLTDKELKKLCALVRKTTGINMNENKRPLIEGRLARRLRKLHLKTFKEYIKVLEHDKNELTEFVNAITTNKTDFFRENEHFELLSKVILPNHIKNNQMNNFRVWSAASSSGEECYTIAMLCNEFFANRVAWKYQILGSDVDTNVLQKAKNGIYKAETIQPIPPMFLKKYFLKGTGENIGTYKVSSSLQERMKFRQFNLMYHQLPVDLMFDVIFLRNVLIYFQPEQIQIIVDNVSRNLKKGGYLLIGHSESLNSITHNFKTVAAATYIKK
jgi:chemotaxis protein methyltransferase CheR